MVKKKVITYKENWHVICDECNHWHLTFPMELDIDKELSSVGWDVKDDKHICIECRLGQKADYVLVCHCCMKYMPIFGHFRSQEEILRACGDRGWLLDGDKYYCPKCWRLDGDEPVVGKPEPRNMIAMRLNEGMVL